MHRTLGIVPIATELRIRRVGWAKGDERFANKSTQQWYKVATPCIDDHQFKEEEIGSVGKFSKVCAQIVLNSCIWLELADVIFCGQ